MPRPAHLGPGRSCLFLSLAPSPLSIPPLQRVRIPGAGVVNWDLWLKKSEIAYMALIVATVLLLPLLDLLGHLRRPAVKTHTPRGKPAASVPLNTPTAPPAACDPPTGLPAPTHTSWRKSCTALVWPFPRLSITAAVFVALFVAFTALTIIVPLAMLSGDELKEPMFISPYQQVRRSRWPYYFNSRQVPLCGARHMRNIGDRANAQT
jgi:hypothetical protein